MLVQINFIFLTNNVCILSVYTYTYDFHSGSNECREDLHVVTFYFWPFVLRSNIRQVSFSDIQDYLVKMYYNYLYNYIKCLKLNTNSIKCQYRLHYEFYNCHYTTVYEETTFKREVESLFFSFAKFYDKNI